MNAELWRLVFFFFNDTATTEIYTLSLHDALPISTPLCTAGSRPARRRAARRSMVSGPSGSRGTRSTSISRSEEHTSELQSQSNLVCRLLLEKKKGAAKSFTSREEAPVSKTSRRSV